MSNQGREESTELSNEAIQASTAKVDGFRQTALRFENDGNFLAAATHWRSAIAEETRGQCRRTELLDFYSNLAECYYFTSQYELAIEAATVVLNREPRKYRVLEIRSRSYSALGRREEAQADANVLLTFSFDVTLKEGLHRQRP